MDEQDDLIDIVDDSDDDESGPTNVQNDSEYDSSDLGTEFSLVSEENDSEDDGSGPGTIQLNNGDSEEEATSGSDTESVGDRESLSSLVSGPNELEILSGSEEVHVVHVSLETGAVQRSSGSSRRGNHSNEARGRIEDSSEQSQSDSEDFQMPVKRRKVEVDTESSNRKDNLNESKDEGQVCSICFEPWTNSGNHRLASLRCGHLFGYYCIDKWLKGQGSKCPQCNDKAKRGDIRVIYAKNIVTLDTTDRDRALQELEKEKKLRIEAQKSEAQAIVQFHLARAECGRLEQRVEELEERLRMQLSSSSSSKMATGNREEGFATASKASQYAGVGNIMVAMKGEARVCAYDPDGRLLVVSKPSTNRLLPGYGLQKVSAVDLRCNEFVSTQQSCIRDAQFSPEGQGLVLTTSMDKALNITSMVSNTVALKYSIPGAGWSCSWDKDDTNYVYCGLHNGSIVTCDIRNTARFLYLHKLEKSVPVTSVAFTPKNRSTGFLNGGLLVGTLEGVNFCEKTATESVLQGYSFSHRLPDGPCTALSYDSLTQHCLVSYRSSKRHPHSQHLIGHISRNSDVFDFHVTHQFQGSVGNNLLARSILYQKPQSNEGHLLSAFPNEPRRTVELRDCSSGTLHQELSGDKEPIVDMCPFTVNHNDFLALLSPHKLLFYKWD